MNEHSQKTTKDGAAQSALAIEQAAAPPPCPSPMPTQVIEFWTPRLLLVTLLYCIGRALRRAARGATFSAADSHEPQ